MMIMLLLSLSRWRGMREFFLRCVRGRKRKGGRCAGTLCGCGPTYLLCELQELAGGGCGYGFQLFASRWLICMCVAVCDLGCCVYQLGLVDSIGPVEG